MAWLRQVAASAPEIFIFLAVAFGTLLGRVRIRGFSLGAPACILIVAVVLGQFGTIVIPSVLKSIFFGLFVFTIGYRSGPEFFASLSLQTLAQVMLALLMGAVFDKAVRKYTQAFEARAHALYDAPARTATARQD